MQETLNRAMFETKQQYIVRWGLTIRGSDVYFPTKEKAIRIGKMALRTEPGTKMFEEYRLWDLTPSEHPTILDEKRFDRTILIQY